MENEGYDFRGKRVFVREDFNVLNEKGEVVNRKRIEKALPTIRFLVERGAIVILLSHQEVEVEEEGRKVKKTLSLAPVNFELMRQLEHEVYFDTYSVTKEGVNLEWMDRLKPGQIFLAENLRRNPGEASKDVAAKEAFAEKLYEKADLVVLDGFGVFHRPHASIVAVPARIPQAIGFLAEKEVTQLSRALEDPARPLVLIVGGKKLDEKVGMLKGLVRQMGKGDAILVGGLAAGPFLSVTEFPPSGNKLAGEVLVEMESRIGAIPEQMRAAYKIRESAAQRGADLIVANILEEDPVSERISLRKDIPPQDRERFAEKIRSAKTIVWAGPMGKFEEPPYDEGTRAIAQAVVEATQRGAVSVVGGGDTGAALEKLGLAEQVTLNSTGGSAALAFLSEGDLPVLERLRELASFTSDNERARDGGRSFDSERSTPLRNRMPSVHALEAAFFP